MPITRSNAPKQLLPGLATIFGLEYKGIDNEHLDLFEVNNSEKAFEEEVLMADFATAPVKTEGAAVTYDTASEQYTARYTHSTIALAFSITEEAWEDNLYDTWSRIRAKALGRAMANTKQTRGANIFNNGFLTGVDAIGDAAAFFSTAHPRASGANQSNTISQDMSEGQLEAVAINIYITEDDRGKLIGARPKSLHIPPQLVFLAQRLLYSPGQPISADNTINAVNSLSVFPGGWKVNHRFTDTDAWFVKTDVPDGTKHFIRAPLATKMEGDFDTGNLRFKARERYSFGVSNWRQWYGSAGA